MNVAVMLARLRMSAHACKVDAVVRAPSLEFTVGG